MARFGPFCGVDWYPFNGENWYTLSYHLQRYPEYKQAREKMIELLTAKNNVERILGVTEKEKNRDRQQGAR